MTGLHSPLPPQAAEEPTHPTLHRRQFVLGPAPVRPDAGWNTRAVDPSLVLSWSPSLPVASAVDSRGGVWHLLGRAVQADADGAPPLVELERMQDGPVERLYRRWAGRWVLIGGETVHTDAGAALGCFYRTVEAGEAAGAWVASSPALISDLPGSPPAAPIGPPLLAISKGMDWYPPPASRFAGVHRLLPSQVLRLAPAGPRIESRRLMADATGQADYGRILDDAERTLRTTVAAYASGASELWLPLTGGVDSRLVLATSVAVGADVTAYTFDRPGLAPGDRELPPRLAAAVGVPHVMIKSGPARPERRSLYDLHTARHSIEIDRELFTRGQWDVVPRSATSMRGGVFEVARGFYRSRFPAELPADDGEAHALIASVFQFDRFHRRSRAHRDGIARWLEWARRTPEPGLDWRDRLYLEQTIAGWLSSTAQGLDLFACELAYPANSHLLIGALLRIDVGRRAAARHHIDLIGRMTPELLQFPFNPPGPIAARARRLVRSELHDVRAYPGRIAYVRHRMRWLRGAVSALVGSGRS